MKVPVTVAILVFLLIIGVFLTQQARPLSILAVSNVEIEHKTGGEDPISGEWVGDNWLILSTSSTYDEHIFYSFDKSKTDQYGQDTVEGEKLIPKSSIEIYVDVAQPYVETTLNQESYEVAPQVYGYHFSLLGGGDTKWRYYYDWDGYNWVEQSGGPIPSKSVNVKETVGDWLVHIPLKFTVIKYDEFGNGVQLTSSDLINGWHNVSGSEALLPIWFGNPDNVEEKLKIKLEGQLGTGFYPDFPSLMIFEDREDLTFEKTTGIIQDIKFDSAETNENSYVNYWYNQEGPIWTEHDDGSIYVHAKGRPAHYRGLVAITGLGQGWDFPKPMYLYEDPPPDPSGTVWKGLIHYIADRHPKIPEWQINKWGLGWGIEGNKLRVNMPFNSYLWLYTIRISTELADTYVYRENIATGDITSAIWKSTGNDYAEIYEYDTLQVKVKNVGNKGNLYLRYELTPTGAPLSVNTDGKLFEENEEHTFEIKALNLGPEEAMEGTLKINCVNDDGEITDDATVRFKLFPKTGAPKLNVLVEEMGTGNKLSDIDVVVSGGTYSETKETSNGWATFDLPSQGWYIAEVKETDEYYGDNVETQAGSGSNSVKLTLLKKGEIIFPWLWVIIIGVMVVIASGLGVYVLKTKGKGRLRRK